MYTVSKEVIIHAAHRLPAMPDGHPCKNLHGHSYRFVVTLATGTLDKEGMTLDFGVISALIKQYDHVFLGGGEVVVDGIPQANALGGYPTTAEVFASVIGGRLTNEVLAKANDGAKANEKIHVVSVELWETATSYVKWTPNNMASLEAQRANTVIG
jgi:6-pyruvoyl-tetrahydropterin synthase